MSSILDSFKTKKGKKEWENLPDESRIQVINAAIQEKYGKVMAQEIAKGIITGGELELENIYNRFVSYIDEFEIDSVDWFNEVDKLLSYIRLKHVNYIAKQERANQAEQNKTEENKNETN